MLNERNFFEGETYYTFSGKPVWIWWEEELEIDYVFDIKITHYENNQVFLYKRTEESQIEFIPPKIGHYVVEARTINKTTEEVGEWISPAVDETVGVASSLEPSRWWIFAWISPPTIED